MPAAAESDIQYSDDALHSGSVQDEVRSASGLLGATRSVDSEGSLMDESGVRDARYRSDQDSSADSVADDGSESTGSARTPVGKPLAQARPGAAGGIGGQGQEYHDRACRIFRVRAAAAGWLHLEE